MFGGIRRFYLAGCGMKSNFAAGCGMTGGQREARCWEFH